MWAEQGRDIEIETQGQDMMRSRAFSCECFFIHTLTDSHAQRTTHTQIYVRHGLVCMFQRPHGWAHVSEVYHMHDWEHEQRST
mmetsp:Transcript_83127/g.134794  ORF Transcript_83127/g.134794 Transcript_83127/m.134794 type:complete len:83 (-) Transcript_83127:59-307(-)